MVVDRIQTYDGRGASTTEEEAAEEAFTREGLTVTPAVPAARLVWSFPAGLRSAGIHEQITVFNPSDEVAEVDITLDLSDPQRNGVLDPFPLEVPAGEARVFDVDSAEAVPERVTHAVEVRSTNDVPVVAERSLSATEGTSYRAELTSTGSPVAAPSWVFAAGTGEGSEGQRIALFNPGEEAVEVTLTAFGDGDPAPLGDGPVAVPAGEHVELDVADLGGLDEGRTSLLVEADGPITAERRFIAAASGEGDDQEPGVGGSTTLGVPLTPGIVVLD